MLTVITVELSKLIIHFKSYDIPKNPILITIKNTKTQSQILFGRPCGAVRTFTGYLLLNAISLTKSSPAVPTNFSRGTYISLRPNLKLSSSRAISFNPGRWEKIVGSKTVLRAHEYKIYFESFRSWTEYVPKRSSSPKTCCSSSDPWS